MLCYTVLLCFCLVVTTAQAQPSGSGTNQTLSNEMLEAFKEIVKEAIQEEAAKAKKEEAAKAAKEAATKTTDDIISFKLDRVKYVLTNEDLESEDIFALEYLKAKLESASEQNSIEDKQKALKDYNTLVEYFGLKSLLPDDYYDYDSIVNAIYDIFFYS